MKHCTYCGQEYPDEVETCPTDGKPLHCAGEQRPSTPVPPDVPSRDLISPEERLFWERMTFRQFAIVIVRLQALWLLFYAVLNLTYLPSYFSSARGALSSAPLYTELSLPLFLAMLRIVLYVAAAMALIQYAEKMLSWLVKDSVPRQPSEIARLDSTPG